MSQRMRPVPGRSTGASSAAAKAGTLSNATRVPPSGDMHGDGAAGALQDEVGGIVAQRDTPGGDRPAAKRDRGMAAHGAEAGVVHEQHAECGGRGGGDHERAVHLGVAARLQHEAAAMKVEARRGVVALFQDAGAAWFGKAGQDETHRFTAGVHLDGAVGGDGEGGQV